MKVPLCIASSANGEAWEEQPLSLKAKSALLALAFLPFSHCQSAAGTCWTPPQPRTVEETVLVAQNTPQAGASSAHQSMAMLALSDGRQRAAYGAGLIIGWGQTGTRPNFAVVTAVGMSALIAPFVFVGHAGDEAIVDVFACATGNLHDMAERAVSRITPTVIETIARRHEAGARLLIALPGSAARRETIWDIGAIAASRHREAKSLIASILLASVDMITFVDPDTAPVKAGLVAMRNPVLRRIGAGEPFLAPPTFRTSPAANYLIHNGVLFADEGDAFAAEQAQLGKSAQPAMWLLPAQELFTTAELHHARIAIASLRPNLNIQPAKSEFDPAFMRTLFEHAFRQGRMRRDWRSSLVDPTHR